MHLIHLTVSPKNSFDIPLSEGYQLYSALLSMIKEEYPETSVTVHDTHLPSLSITGLSGRFDVSPHKGQKRVKTGELYQWRIGVSAPSDEDLFTQIITPFLIHRKEIALYNGELTIQSIDTVSQSYHDIFEKVQTYKHPSITIDFLTPTCIQYKNTRVTEMFPHRIAVFFSILSKFNQVCPQAFRISLARDDLGRYLIEHPDPKTYRTHSVLTNTIVDAKKMHPRPIFKQGFSGRCRYHFTSDATRAFRNAILILAHFAEYCGVGSSVARGCGQVHVTITEEDHDH